MKIITCEKCGANDLIEQNGYMICRYCSSKYVLQKNDILAKSSNIALSDDIKMLLEKCKKDPINARRYASLVLDIDPPNKEALKYLK